MEYIPGICDQYCAEYTCLNMHLCWPVVQVLSSGDTHDFLEEGSLKSVYGADDTEDDDEGHVKDGRENAKGARSSNNSGSANVGNNVPGHGANHARRKVRKAHKRLLGARIVTLREGDCLLVPAGLYHDVESSVETGPALSITVRFLCHPHHCPVGRSAAIVNRSDSSSRDSRSRGSGGGGGVVPPNGNACVRPFGHWGAHVSEGGDACVIQSNALATATVARAATVAAAAPANNGAAATSGETAKAMLGTGVEPKDSKGAMFRRWRESTISDCANNAETSNSTSTKRHGTGSSSRATEPENSKGAMFRRWRESTLSDEDANSTKTSPSSCSNKDISSSLSNESDCSQKQMFSKWRQMSAAAAPDRPAPTVDSPPLGSNSGPIANPASSITGSQSSTLFRRWKDETHAAPRSKSTCIERDAATVTSEATSGASQTSSAPAVDLDVD